MICSSRVHLHLRQLQQSGVVTPRAWQCPASCRTRQESGVPRATRLLCHASTDGPSPNARPAGSSPSQSPAVASGVSGTPVSQSSTFGQIERMIAGNFDNLQPGLRGDWQEVQGNWVLRPLAGPPKAVVHFLGGAFVGAAPQLTYRLFLETLAARGILVIATPFSTSFDHLAIADEIHYKFQMAMAALQGEGISDLPLFGLGHSMGALQHLIVSSRYVSSRQGNMLMSFNNKPATESIPFFSPFIAPGARAFGSILAQVAANPFTSQLLNGAEMLRGVSPALVRQLMPLMDQLTPIYLDVAQGRVEFHPEPQETRALVRSYYGVSRNLLVRFVSDQIDETPQLASMLQTSTVATSSTSSSLSLTVRNLPGDHVRPLRQAFRDLPPELAQVATQAVSQGSDLLRGLSQMAMQAGLPQATEPLDAFKKGLTGFAEVFGNSSAGSNNDDTEQLVDELVDWMNVGTTKRSAPVQLPAGQGSAGHLPS